MRWQDVLEISFCGGHDVGTVLADECAEVLDVDDRGRRPDDRGQEVEPVTSEVRPRGERKGTDPHGGL
jgi:hypothetical protein